MEYRYDIGNFYWNKEANTFFAEAWNLECFLPEGSIHPYAFPNQKEQFFIDNPKTGGFRRFRFLKESTETFVGIDYNEMEFSFETTNWLFESEDGIKCSICVAEI
jgi:hypothetical protein